MKQKDDNNICHERCFILLNMDRKLNYVYLSLEAMANCIAI